jgi:hypothetical protein
MYNQLLPPDSLCVATTFNAVGYFSRRPLERLPGFIQPNGPSAARNIGTVTAKERAEFAQQARLIRENPESYDFHYVCVATLMTRL